MNKRLPSDTPGCNKGWYLTHMENCGDDDEKTLVVHEGQAVAESVDVVHRGESGDKPTVLLITYAGTPGVPTSIPANGEKPEY